MSNAADPQDMAEQLDTDKVGEHDDPDIEPDYPADELMGADEYGITAAEERVDEPLDEREDRELPDPLAAELDAEVALEDSERDPTSLEADLDRVERQLDEDVQDLVDAQEPLSASDFVEDGDEPVGRIIESGTDEDVTDFIDVEADSVGESTPADDLSAEEEAMHVTADPPMGRPGGGYVD